MTLALLYIGPDMPRSASRPASLGKHRDISPCMTDAWLVYHLAVPMLMRSRKDLIDGMSQTLFVQEDLNKDIVRTW